MDGPGWKNIIMCLIQTLLYFDVILVCFIVPFQTYVICLHNPNLPRCVTESRNVLLLCRTVCGNWRLWAGCVVVLGAAWVNRFANAGDAAVEAAGNTMERVRLF